MSTIQIEVTLEGEKHYGQSIVRKYDRDKLGMLDLNLIVQDMVDTIEEADEDLKSKHALADKV